jgi:hypothetical protein
MFPFDDYSLEDWADAHCEDPAQIRRSQRRQNVEEEPEDETNEE